MAAADYDFNDVVSGDTFERSFTFNDSVGQPVNLTGHVFKMQIRSGSNLATLILELSNSNGRIVVTGNLGKVDMLVSASDMSNVPPGLYIYRLRSTDGAGKVKTWMKGKFEVEEQVTYL